MLELVVAIVITAAVFAVHLIWWRIQRPRGSGRAVLMLFSVGPLLAGLLLFFSSFVAPSMVHWLPGSWSAWLYALVLSLAFGASYVMTYPAVEVKSPTLLIIEEVRDTKCNGLSLAELNHRLDADVLLRPRVNDLVNEGLIELSQERYCITARGRTLARLFGRWRALLGAGKGG